MSQDEPAENKRIGDRRRHLKGGKIASGQGRSVIDCTVRNVSKTGAQLTVENGIAVPQKFELRWDGNVQRCVVIWRKVTSVGVKFDTCFSFTNPCPS